MQKTRKKPTTSEPRIIISDLRKNNSMHGYKIKQRTEPAFCFFLRNKKTETNTLPTPLRFDVVRLHGYIHPEYLRRTQTKQPAGYIVSLKISPETHLLSLLGLSQTHQKLLVRFDGTREQSTEPTIISDSPRQSGVWRTSDEKLCLVHNRWVNMARRLLSRRAGLTRTPCSRNPFIFVC